MTTTNTRLNQQITHAEICEYRRTRVAEMYVKGRSSKLIAADLGCSIDTVRADLEIIHAEWRTARAAYISQANNEQLEKFDRLEWEANEAWERSKRPAKITTVTEDDDGRTVTKIERRESVGDPQFLAQVIKVCDQRQKLLGMNAPIKTESNINATVTHYQPPKTREEIAAEVQKMRDRVREQLQAQSPN